MNEKRGNEPFNFAGGCNRNVALPPLAEDAKFRYSLFYRGKPEIDISSGYARSLIQFFDSMGQPAKTTREFVQFSFLPEKEWKKASIEFVVPKATRSLGINLYLDNCGEVFGRRCTASHGYRKRLDRAAGAGVFRR